MTVRVDTSSSTSLAVCTRCPSFRALRSSAAAAWAAGVTHERAVHPGETQAEKAAAARKRRA